MNNLAMSLSKQLQSRLRGTSVVAAAVPSGGAFRAPFFELPPLGTAAATTEIKKRILLAVLLGICLSAPLPVRAQTGPTDDVGPLAKVTLHIGKASLATKIAATPAQEERGLMYVAKLPDNDGMIFFQPRVATATFWMKNTLIPLSVAFIDKNGVILEIHDMKALDETITRSDSDQVAYALETNLHWFALNGVKPGDKITPPPATLGK